MGLKGAKICSLITFTHPACWNKRHQERITKLAKRTVMIGANYERSVNRQRDRENLPNNFTADLMWGGFGEHLGPNIIRHTVKHTEYLVFYPLKRDVTGQVVSENCQYYVDNIPVASGGVLPLLRLPSRPRKQKTARMIPWRVVELCNVKELHIDGEVIILEH